MTKDVENEIIRLYNLGVSKTNIAKQVGVSRSTITRFFSELKVPNIDPMIGQTFNRLTVLSLDDKKYSNGKHYICQCECGNIKSISGSSLRSGHTKSCGCLQKEKVTELGHNNKKDLTGMRFGKLTVISFYGVTDSNKSIWHCKCDCGNETNVRACNLISGNTQSCGCIHSVNEENIIKILIDRKVDYKTQISFDDLKGKSKKLRFDFGLYKDNQLICLIEYQGEQHTNIHNPWHTESLEEYDNKKRQYCIDKQIPLYELNKNNWKMELERICNSL